MTGTAPTTDELIVWAMALQAQPGDVVVVGVATPMAVAAALLARELTAPDLTIIAGGAVNPALHDIAAPMVDPGLLGRIGVTTLSQTEILDQIQRGRISLQFISPAQVDGLGRLNTSRIADGSGWRRLPGGLATGDISVLVGRLVAYRAAHRRRFLPAEVDFVTGAGHDLTPVERRARRLPGAGVMAIVTDQAVLQWTGGGWAVASVHGAGTSESVEAGCGFTPAMPESLPKTPPPPPEALDLLRRVIDPHGLRRLEVRDTKAAALSTLEELQR